MNLFNILSIPGEVCCFYRKKLNTVRQECRDPFIFGGQLSYWAIDQSL